MTGMFPGSRDQKESAMKAIVQHEDGLRLAEIAAPVPAADEVLVRVHACALNRADLAMAAGHKHGTLGGSGSVLGLETRPTGLTMPARPTRA